MEGQAEDLDAEVNGIAGQISFRPAPIGLLEDETGIGGQTKIARLACDDLEPALVQQSERVSPRNQVIMGLTAGGGGCKITEINLKQMKLAQEHEQIWEKEG